MTLVPTSTNARVHALLFRRSRPMAARLSLLTQGPRSRAAGGARKGRAHLDLSVDGGYAFLLLLAMLFSQTAGALSGVAMTVLPVSYMIVRRRKLGAVVASQWPLFLPPAVALLSVLWSEAPDVSGKYAIELWLTVAAGIGLAVAERPTAVLKGICLAFVLYVGACLRYGHATFDGAGDTAFLGLAGGKNLIADIASTGVMISLAVCFIAIRQRSLFWWMLSSFALALELYVALQARSAGAILALSAATCAFVAFAALGQAPRALRVAATLTMLVIAGIIAAVSRDIGAALINYGAQLFDKDATLTGRTYLWYRAQDLISEKPWFGRGFYAFWRQGNTDAEGLWQYAGIVGRGGFNFHNALIELTVQLGLVGAGVFALIALVGLASLVWRFMRKPSLPLCFWMTLFLYAMIRAPTESVGQAPFYYSTVLIFAGAAFGLARPARPLAHKRYRAQILRLRPRTGPVQGQRRPFARPVRPALAR